MTGPRCSCPRCCPDSPYPVLPCRGWPPDLSPEIENRLHDLSTALNSCSEPLLSAWRELSWQDVAAGLRTVPEQYRSAILHMVGIRVRPRTFGRSLCEDLRRRTEQAPFRTLRTVAAMLSTTVFSNLENEANAQETKRDPSAHVRPARTQSRERERVAVWSTPAASVQDARMWSWAARRPWFAPSSVEREQVEAIIEASDAVVALAPDHRFLGGTSDLEAVPRPFDDEDPRNVVHGGNEMAIVSENTPDAHGEERGTSMVRFSLDELRDAGDRLGQMMSRALPAARRIVETVSADRAPREDDLEILIEVRMSFERVLAALDEFGRSPDEETVRAVRETIGIVHEAASDSTVRERLGDFSRLRAKNNGTALRSELDQVRSRAEALAGSAPWTPQDRDRALALVSFLELTDPALPRPDKYECLTSFLQLHDDLLRLGLCVDELFVAPSGTCPEDRERRSPDRMVTTEVPINSSEEEHESVGEPGTADRLHDPERGGPVLGSPSVHRAQEGDDERADSGTSAVPVNGGDGSGETLGELSALIADRRFGLAATLSQTAGMSEQRTAVLRIAALSMGAVTPTGECIRALEEELTSLDVDSVQEDNAFSLIMASALVRTVLVTGNPTAGAFLQGITRGLGPDLAALTQQIAGRAVQGALVGVQQAINETTDVALVEQTLRRSREEARCFLERPRTINYKRATDIARLWLDPKGLLGGLLTVVRDDDQSSLPETAEAVRRLSTSKNLVGEIDELDRRLRGPGRRRLEGTARQNLIALATDALRTISLWIDTVLVLRQARESRPWQVTQITDLRSQMLQNRERVFEVLTERIGRSDPLEQGASKAALAFLDSVFGLLERTDVLPGSEKVLALVRSAELLKVPGARIDEALTQIEVPVGTEIEDLLVAGRRTWPEAVEEQIAAERFDTASFIIRSSDQIVPSGEEPPGPGTNTKITRAREEVEKELREFKDDLLSELRCARTDNEISEEQAGELTGLLEDADPSRTADLASVRAVLDQVSEGLSGYREEAAERLSERLSGLQDRIPDSIDRIRGLIAQGDLSTAEELIYFLEIGEEVPQLPEEPDLQDFFPGVPDSLPGGLTPEILGTVRSRAVVEGCSPLDYRELSADLAHATADALRCWRDLARTPPEMRSRVTERDLLLPALRLVGIEGKRVHRLDDLPRNRDLRFVDVKDVTINGNALVPAFGTKLSGRLRVLFAWGLLNAEMVMSHADRDPAGESLLIAYFGTMSSRNRRELARLVVSESRSAPVIVLDDAALAYLVAKGNRRMDATMSVLLPFCAANPYVSKKRGLVAEEMFYGRDAERKSVLDPDGTALVYGGRGLGKSALLRNAKTVFEARGTAGARIGVYRSLDIVGIRAGSPNGPDAIWDTLHDALVESQVMPLPTARSRRRNAHDQVRAGCLGWIDKDSQRRLLILFDEADAFFEADSPEFRETRRLKDLGTTTDGRIKIVFAGLHSVQRYARSTRNDPFSHLAQRPTVIGPLRPQFAANLLTRPLQALGYRFADADLVNRVLGYCSYQPFLLQLFGYRLIARMHENRTNGMAVGEPPFTITHDDIVSVENQTDLKADISAAFHDTLHLDPRYDVIANVLAHHAHENGLDARLSDAELRAECRGYWDRGFAPLDVEAFRAYLQEMVGLGVLAPNNDGRGWHLRSPNVLRMIGSLDEITNRLLDADRASVPPEFVAGETRLRLANGRCSPLTATQSDDVLGDHANQVRIVLGSRATGIEDVTVAIRCAAGEGGRFTVPDITSRRRFEEELVKGRPGERRVIMTDLYALDPSAESCLDALASARTCLPKDSGVTRSVVIVAGPRQRGLWRAVLSATGSDPGTGTVHLRRYTSRTLNVWSMNSEKFTTQERRERLLGTTGGWPILVERAARLVAEGREEHDAILAVDELLESVHGSREFVDDVGISLDGELAGAFALIRGLVPSPGWEKPEGIVSVLEEEYSDPEGVLACLQALSVMDVREDGQLRPDPLLGSVLDRLADRSL